MLHQSKPNKIVVFTQDVYTWKGIDLNQSSSSHLKPYLSIRRKGEVARLSIAGMALEAIIVMIKRNFWIIISEQKSN